MLREPINWQELFTNELNKGIEKGGIVNLTLYLLLGKTVETTPLSSRHFSNNF